MDEIPNDKTFTNLEDWLEWFKSETFPPMRRAFLNGIFAVVRFEDSYSLVNRTAKKTQLKYIMEALKTEGLTDETVEHGLTLIFLRIIKWTKRNRPWPAVFSKSDIIGFLKFLEEMHQSYQLRSPNLSDYSKCFLREVLFYFRPETNSHDENMQIVRAVIECKHVQLFHQLWRGREEVISELAKQFPQGEDPFGNKWKHGVSDELAIHLAAAGKFDYLLADYL